MSTLFPPWQPTQIPIRGSKNTFPVRRIFCVGRNYAAHAREMGSDPDKQPPCFFAKPCDALLVGGGDVPYPPATEDLHHEIELVVGVGATLTDAGPSEAIRGAVAYGVGLDLTRRDLQRVAKDRRWPWALSKGFAAAAPVSSLCSAREIGHPTRGAIWLDVNGERRQEADLADLIWAVDEVLAHLSTLVTLHPGDLVFTGTPAGVGPLVVGDKLHGHVDGVGNLHVRIAAGDRQR